MVDIQLQKRTARKISIEISNRQNELGGVEYSSSQTIKLPLHGVTNGKKT